MSMLAGEKVTQTKDAANEGKSTELSVIITSNEKTNHTARRLSHTHDSDSGVERTSSSSASNCSEDDHGDDDNNQIDCFVDASDNLQNLSEQNGQQHGASSNRVNGGTNAEQQDEVDNEDKYEAEGHDQLQSVNPLGASTGLSEPVHDEHRVSLKVRLDETAAVLRLALNNEFNKAIDSCEERAKSELYAGLAHATLSFLRASLTVEQADLQVALANINQSAEVSQQKRRQVSTASMVMRFLYKPNYNTYTDDEIHAELVNAESMLLLSLISFLSDQSVLCLVRGALRIRSCYQRYKECRYILDNRSTWSSETTRAHFESGVRMGYGIFNLLMSYLPRRVLKFLEYVGFSGSRSIGVAELEKSIALDDGLRSVFSALVILTYHSYVENLFGLGNYDAAKVSQLNTTFLSHYPNSAFFLLFKGRYNQMQGKLSEAIESFERCCQVQQDWKQFHSLCHWEIMWCYACQMNWPKAAHYADLLRAHSKWSPASYQYQYGTFLYAQLVREQRQGLLDEKSDDYKRRLSEIRSIIDRVPALRIRYAGKTIPADKFAITRSDKFAQRNSRLSLPALEFLYIWNIFCTLKNSPNQVGALLATIDDEIVHINKLIDAHHSDTTQPAQLATQSDATNAAAAAAEDNDNSFGGRNQMILNDGQAASDEFDKIESECENSSATSGADCWIDDLCLMYLLKGMCLKHLNRFEEAEATFIKVIDHEHQIVSDKFIVPHSAMELAILNLHLKRYDTAKSWSKLARNNYTGYLMETIVHFRLHAVSRLIRIEQHQRDQDEEDEDFERACSQSPCPSPAETIGRHQLAAT